MILIGICTPLFLILTSVIALLPNSVFESQSAVGLVGMFSTAFQFFPADVWILALGSITFWITVHLAIGAFKFIRSLLPF